MCYLWKFLCLSIALLHLKSKLKTIHWITDKCSIHAAISDPSPLEEADVEWIPDIRHWIIYTAGVLVLFCSYCNCALGLPSWSRKVFIFDLTGAYSWDFKNILNLF